MMKKKKLKKKKQQKRTGYDRPIQEKKGRPAYMAGRPVKEPVKIGRRGKKLIGALLTLAVIFGILAGVYAYIIKAYTITTIYVEGNLHYTNEEIISMVMDDSYGRNSLILSWKYKDKSITDVPFIEKMDVSVLDPHTVKIDVYEKALAGYVEYLERYMYFDRDGIIVESSKEKTPGIPLVTGLSFEHVILHQPLPVENPDVFKDVLSITQLTNKYQLNMDRIYFGSDESITLYFDRVKVALGTREFLEEKVMQLQYMLPTLTGKSGVLRMENYSEETKTFTFEPD